MTALQPPSILLKAKCYYPESLEKSRLSGRRFIQLEAGLAPSSSPAALSSFITAGWCSAFPTLGCSPRCGNVPTTKRAEAAHLPPSNTGGRSECRALLWARLRGRARRPAPSHRPAPSQRTPGMRRRLGARQPRAAIHLPPAPGPRGGAAAATAFLSTRGNHFPPGPHGEDHGHHSSRSMSARYSVMFCSMSAWDKSTWPTRLIPCARA